MQHRSHNQRGLNPGEGVCIQGGLSIGGLGRPLPPELGKRAVRVPLECFLVYVSLRNARTWPAVSHSPRAYAFPSFIMVTA